ncbi:hypothetical protein Leryth_016923 [Lithospermum erythrorhizon]|nr:hypothetical protein Leryth_016923 [Lithospermum erythrorhizon]
MSQAPSISYPTRLLMDQPLPPCPTTIVDSPATANNNAINVASPCLNRIEKMDEPLAPLPGAKLRLMCSYGGRIIPRPHDKTLCYVGGETRMVVVDRKSSLSDVHSRLCCTLLGGRKFTFKYQLPNEELDNLVSVTTDEDMENMIEEYDRVMSASPSKPSRLRLFLFLAKPETAASMSALLDNGESWFIDALNGADLLQRGVSDSAAIDNLIEFDGMLKGDQPDDVGDTKQMVRGVDQEVHITMPDSPMVETTSSFDSSISSPSMANIPQINATTEDGDTRLQEHLSGLGEQMLQMHVASTVQPSFPPDHSCIATIPSSVGGNSTAVLLDNHRRVISPDERPDKTTSVGLRKPPLQLQPIQRTFTDPYSLPSPNSKYTGAYSLQSPESVASDGSFTSPASHSNHPVYLDPPSPAYEDNRFPASNYSKDDIGNSSPHKQMQQANDPKMLPSLQQNVQQHQFVNSNAQYIQHLAPSLAPDSSYYPMYAAKNQQQFHQHYPVYLMPVDRPQPFNLSQKSIVANATSVAPTPSNPPIYYAETTTRTSPEKLPGSPKTVPEPTSPYNYLLPNQVQQQYYCVPQVQCPSQFIHNYGNEQLKYVQYLPTQYQPMTLAKPTSQASTKQSADNDTRRIKTSQQL